MTRLAGADRREAILNATVDIVLGKGIVAATTRDVTARIGVGVGLLSHYFNWAELRSLAFERIVRADLEQSIMARSGEPARTVLDDLVAGSFEQQMDPVWRVWIEACNLASNDAVLAARVSACTDIWRIAIRELLERGCSEGHWSCADPDGASWRLIAMFDGLSGLVAAPNSRLSRMSATAYLAKSVADECSTAS
jgi:AcrR family transcriptional regulator